MSVGDADADAADSLWLPVGKSGVNQQGAELRIFRPDRGKDC